MHGVRAGIEPETFQPLSRTFYHSTTAPIKWPTIPACSAFYPRRSMLAQPAPLPTSHRSFPAFIADLGQVPSPLIQQTVTKLQPAYTSDCEPPLAGLSHRYTGQVRTAIGLTCWSYQTYAGVRPAVRPVTTRLLPDILELPSWRRAEDSNPCASLRPDRVQTGFLTWRGTLQELDAGFKPATPGSVSPMTQHQVTSSTGD